LVKTTKTKQKTKAKQTKPKKNKKKTNKQHKFDDPLKHLVFYGSTFYSCLF